MQAIDRLQAVSVPSLGSDGQMLVAMCVVQPLGTDYHELGAGRDGRTIFQDSLMAPIWLLVWLCTACLGKGV